MTFDNISDWYKAAHKACEMLLVDDEDSPSIVPAANADGAVVSSLAVVVREDNDF